METSPSKSNVPSVTSSHFSLAETDLIKNFDNDAKKAEEEHEIAFRRIREPAAQPPPDSSPPSDTDSLDEYLESTYNRDRKVFLVLFGCVTAITAILLSFVVYILTSWLRGFGFHPDSASDDDYNIHLIVMIIGSLMLPAYGMLIFRMFPDVSYSTLVNYHIAITVVAIIMTVFGIKVAYDAHHLYADTHLYSLHSWFGFVIFILQFVELITGNWLYFGSFPQPIMKYWHTVVGTVIFLWSGAASSSGLIYRASLLLKKDDGRLDKKSQFTLNAFGVFATLFAILVRYLCSDYRFRRGARPVKGSGYKSTKLADADPFTQDTFEYGAARKSIFVGADTVEEFHKASTPVDSGSRTDIDKLVDIDHFEDTWIYYGPSLHRNTITRRSIAYELTKLNYRRESRGISQSDDNEAAERGASNTNASRQRLRLRQEHLE